MPKLTINHDRYVPALINFVANKLSTGASSAYRREFGIGVTEWRILSLLAAEETCSAQQICQFFDLDKGLVSRTTRSLAKNGIVIISAQTRESKRAVTLTKTGRTLHDRIIRLALDRERALLACLTKAEIDIIIDLLRRMLTQMPAVNAVVPMKANRTYSVRKQSQPMPPNRSPASASNPPQTKRPG
jgi:DNA-binding MarR family transcriptional regulator